MNLKRIARLGLGSLFAIALAGCASERPPINRVQANALDKHFFAGDDIQNPGDDPEFYWRNYVVDAPTSQSLIGVGSSSMMAARVCAELAALKGCLPVTIS